MKFKPYAERYLLSTKLALLLFILPYTSEFLQCVLTENAQLSDFVTIARISNSNIASKTNLRKLIWEVGKIAT
jgi:hypothetical protein